METFAERLKNARQRRGWTQEQLADEIGVSQQTIQKWESGKASPRAKRGEAIAAALDDAKVIGASPRIKLSTELLEKYRAAIPRSVSWHIGVPGHVKASAKFAELEELLPESLYQFFKREPETHQDSRKDRHLTEYLSPKLAAEFILGNKASASIYQVLWRLATLRLMHEQLLAGVRRYVLFSFAPVPSRLIADAEYHDITIIQVGSMRDIAAAMCTIEGETPLAPVPSPRDEIDEQNGE